MKMTLRRPCKGCPFRTDVPFYLRPGRAQEIAEAIAKGSPFPCHETTVADEDEHTMVSTPDSQFCAGALIAMEKDEGGPNQVMRLAERLGLWDRERLDMNAPVVGSLAEFVRRAVELEGDEEPEPCCVCDPGCEAPAGMLVDGYVVPLTEHGLTSECPGCGQQVCASCSDEDGVCADCPAS